MILQPNQLRAFREARRLDPKNPGNKKRFSSTACAQRVGIVQTYYGSVEAGRHPISEKSLIDWLIRIFDFKLSEAKEIVFKWSTELQAEKLGINQIELGIPEERMAALISEKRFLDKIGGGKIIGPDDFTTIPILGTVSCGPLKDSDVIGYELVESTSIEKGKTYYFVMANGFSMQGKIDHGDKLLVEQTSENTSGRIMIFGLRGEYAAGYLYEDNGFYEIKKANKDYPPIKINDPDFYIAGVVKQIIKTNP